MKNGVVGCVVGVIVGALGVAVHAGFVDVPVFGPIIGAILLAAGAWFVDEWFSTTGWLTYLLGSIGVTLALLLGWWGDDIPVVPTTWVTYAWLVVAPVAVLVPRAIGWWRRRKKGENSPYGAGHAG